MRHSVPFEVLIVFANGAGITSGGLSLRTAAYRSLWHVQYKCSLLVSIAFNWGCGLLLLMDFV